MPIKRAKSGFLSLFARETGIPAYVHTVNDVREAACMIALGATGIYSDDLGIGELANLPEAQVDCQGI